ncbi:hypothetical protein [Rubinisphaera brasiliensis]|uniref:hypothetical protein n=1 Tax=Rubinisphaera brasiliensis TaxID=119 RepID=UPI001237537A|nr:hypothetical protein [Rubinisphaera brasiliensis]
MEMITIMNTPKSNNPEISPNNPWPALFQQEWQRQILDDTTNIDVDLIAAYAEGALSEGEERKVEKLLAESPAALDMLVAMREQIADSDLAEAAEAGASSHRVVGPTDVPPSRDSPRKAADQMGSASSSAVRMRWVAMAASVAVAVGAVSWSVLSSTKVGRLDRQVAALDQQIVQQAEALTLAQREQLALLSGTPTYLAGVVSPELIHLAMAGEAVTVRGIDNAQHVIKLKYGSLDRGSAALKQWQDAIPDKSLADVLVNRASLEIAAGQFDAARDTIDSVTQSVGEDSADVLNLRAILLLAFAETQPLAEAEKSYQQAQSLLERLTTEHPDFANGWLNLALFRSRLQGPQSPDTRAAWDRYLAVETRAELKAAVRSQLEQTESR